MIDKSSSLKEVRNNNTVVLINVENLPAMLKELDKQGVELYLPVSNGRIMISDNSKLHRVKSVVGNSKEYGFVTVTTVTGMVVDLHALINIVGVIKND